MKYLETQTNSMTESYIIYGMKRRIPEVQEWGNDYIIEQMGRDGEYWNRTHRKYPTPIFNAETRECEVTPFIESGYREDEWIDGV